MLQSINVKILLASLAGGITIISYIPYLKDLFTGKTKPHSYTWLIWLLTQGTATAALIHGGGGFGAIALIAGTGLVGIVFLLSFKYGTRDITKLDSVALLFALVAIFLWWVFDNPYIAVFLIVIIDTVGYIPTIRKTFRDPTSETLSFWIAMVFVNALIIASIGQVNFLTITYPVMLSIMNMVVVILIILRRKKQCN